MNSIPSDYQNLKVILAHDWLTGMRGGERVLEYLCRLFPQAPIYTLFCNPAAVSDTIKSHKIITSRLQHIPGILKFYRNFLPLFPAAIESMRPMKANLVISTSHCVAKGLIAPPNARHLCYCFTPMRYAWVFYEEYFGSNLLKNKVLSPMLNRLRKWDKESAVRIDCFVTLSKHVQKRIKDFYGRDADVVYPPVNLDFWNPENNNFAGQLRGNYDLIVSALVPYKRIDLAVRAYNKLGYPLKIAGAGTEFRKLAALAKNNIEFLGFIPDESLRGLYRNCRALIFPGEEDFGIVPLEAQSCGKPVVAFARGGVLETVLDGSTGIFFKEQNETALLNAIECCAFQKWDPAIIRNNAKKFSEENFINGLKTCIEKCITNRKVISAAVC